MRVSLLFACLAAAVSFFLGGCAVEPVVFSEVFQQKQGEKLYTRYNIWYTDPENISCLNIQSGSILPIGTEIEPVGTNWRDQIIFKDMEGREYRIKFDAGYRLCTMRDFIAYTFTTEPPSEFLRDVPEAALARIHRGEVVPGMSRADVLFAYGPPPSIRTPNLRNESWIYWYGSDNQSVRVVFRGDKVRNIIKAE